MARYRRPGSVHLDVTTDLEALVVVCENEGGKTTGGPDAPSGSDKRLWCGQ